MCDPTTIMMGISAAGGVAQGSAQRATADAQAADEDYAAGIERENALAEAGGIRRAGAKQRGAAVAQYAASGVKVGEGAALDVEREIAQGAAQDEYTAIITGSRREAAMRKSAINRRAAGRDAQTGAYLDAGTSLMAQGSDRARANGWKGQPVSGYDARGFNGTNDRSWASLGGSNDWWLRNGRGGD